MNRNALYVIIVVLAAGAAVLGYMVYKDRQGPNGVQIKVGDKSLSIEKK